MEFDVYENPNREKKKGKRKLFKINPAISRLLVFLIIVGGMYALMVIAKTNRDNVISDVKVRIMEQIDEYQVSTITGAVSLSSRLMKDVEGLDIWPEQNGNVVTYHCTYKGIQFDVEGVFRQLREQ